MLCNATANVNGTADGDGGGGAGSDAVKLNSGVNAPINRETGDEVISGNLEEGGEGDCGKCILEGSSLSSSSSPSRHSQHLYDLNSNDNKTTSGLSHFSLDQDYDRECEPFLVTLKRRMPPATCQSNSNNDKDSPHLLGKQYLLTVASDSYIILRSVESASIVDVIDTR